MAKEIKEYYEENEWGRYKIKEKSNGIKVRLLIEPSQAYKDKMAKRQAEFKVKYEAEQKELEKKKLIDSKMRELAIKQLQDEGKLDSDGNMI